MPRGLAKRMITIDLSAVGIQRAVVLRPQAAAAGLYLKRESGRWRGLITSEPG